jgi:hypothetical protein
MYLTDHTLGSCNPNKTRTNKSVDVRVLLVDRGGRVAIMPPTIKEPAPQRRVEKKTKNLLDFPLKSAKIVY